MPLEALLLFRHPRYLCCHSMMMLVYSQLLIPWSSQACSCRAATWPVVLIACYSFYWCWQSICWVSLVACPAGNIPSHRWVLLSWEVLYIMRDSKEIWHVVKPSNMIFNVSDTMQNSGGVFFSRPKLHFHCSVILLHLIEVLVMPWL